jgi:hypothetical protein
MITINAKRKYYLASIKSQELSFFLDQETRVLCFRREAVVFFADIRERSCTRLLSFLVRCAPAGLFHPLSPFSTVENPT